MAIITGTNSRSNSSSMASILLFLLLPPSSPPPHSVLSHKLRPLPTDRLNGVTCSISCLHLIRCSVILRRGADRPAAASRLFLNRLRFIFLHSSAARRRAAAFTSHQSYFFFLSFLFPSSSSCLPSHRQLLNIHASFLPMTALQTLGNN